MKKVISSKYSNARDRYTSRENLRQRSEDAQQRVRQAWRSAERSKLDPIQSKLMELLAPYDQDVEIRVEYYYLDESIRITISRERHGQAAANTALNWHCDITISQDGEVKKETGSWSGLDAITPEQVNDLQNTVNALKEIQSINWVDLVSDALNNRPSYDEFRDEDAQRDMEAFRNSEEVTERDLSIALIEDLIGTNTAVQVYNWSEESTGVRKKLIWILPVKDSSSMVTVQIYPGYYGDDPESVRTGFEGRTWTQRVRKSNLLVPHIVDGTYNTVEL